MPTFTKQPHKFTLPKPEKVKKLKKNIHSLLSRPKFRKYLQAKKAHVKVGVTCSGQGCPIYTYLHESVGSDLHAVTSHHIMLNARLIPGAEGWGAFHTVDTPLWAKKFITKLDGGRNFHEDVQAGEALNLLMSIKK